MTRQYLRVRDFCERYAVSRATFYRLVKQGAFKTYKIGTATRVRLSEAEEWFASLPCSEDRQDA